MNNLHFYDQWENINSPAQLRELYAGDFFHIPSSIITMAQKKVYLSKKPAHF